MNKKEIKCLMAYAGFPTADMKQPLGQTSFIEACKAFTGIADECYPDHLLVLFASEPPQEDNPVTGACAWPEADKMDQAFQMISGMMAQNKDVCHLMLASVGRWISNIFGEDKETKYQELLSGFKDDLRIRRRIQERAKEMFPDADSQ